MMYSGPTRGLVGLEMRGWKLVEGLVSHEML